MVGVEGERVFEVAACGDHWGDGEKDGLGGEHPDAPCAGVRGLESREWSPD